MIVHWVSNQLNTKGMENRYLIGIALCSLFSTCKDEVNEEGRERYETGKVVIGIKEGVDIEESFDLVNQYGFIIDEASGNHYTSSLPSDSLDYVINYLNSKEYINHSGFKAVKEGSVYLQYQTKVLTVNCILWNMTIENQRDWIQTKSILKLTDKSNYRSMIFNVPGKQEKMWVLTFKHMEEIRYAELNCIMEMNSWP
jgi:hypothetical protein